MKMKGKVFSRFKTKRRNHESDKFGFIQIKDFCFSNETVKRMKRQARLGEKIFKSHI